MTVRFIDTNVLLYAVSGHRDDAQKRRIADEILASRDLVLSAQVLQEFYVQATRTTREDRLTHREAADYITVFARFPVQAITVDVVRAALETRERYRISYWDAAVIEAARMAGCTEVITEDLNHGQDFDGVVVTNPFR